MTKPLSREKILDAIKADKENGFLTHTVNELIESFNSDIFDADEPEVDIAELTQFVKDFPIPSQASAYKNAIISYIESKLTKEPEVEEQKSSCVNFVSVVPGTFECVKCHNKNLIDADELIDDIKKMSSVRQVSIDDGYISDHILKEGVISLIKSKLRAKEEELKPCPFCGSINIKIVRDEHGDFYVSCGETGDCTIYVQADTEAHVRKAWNKRA